MKVLIVEDDKNLAYTTKIALEKDFTIYTALDGKTALRLVNEIEPDVILLDIMLPDCDGYDLIPFFKKQYSPIVIMVSALEEEQTRLAAYQKGADDYMIKPITLFEIRYKLKALKKRVSENHKVIHVGDLILNAESNELSCQNNTVLFTYSQTALFKLLYKKHNDKEVLTKEEILEFEDASKTMSVRVHTAISRIRRNLTSIGCEKVFIENVYGEGYRMVVLK